MAGEIVEGVLGRYDPDGELRLQLSALPPPQSSAARYQAAMNFVVTSYGQDKLNEIVRQAVLRARKHHDSPSKTLDELNRTTDGWDMSPAVAALGRIIASHRASCSLPLLTTNFDPLLELSIRAAGRPALAIHLAADGRFDNVNEPDAAQIVHMHGYWIGSDTLHTPQQIERPRPQLRNCLRGLLSSSTLVVVGYGGWSDEFTRTLVETLREGDRKFDVLWTLYSNDVDTIERDHGSLLDIAKESGTSRLTLYKGIDCHKFFPALESVVRAIPTRKFDDWKPARHNEEPLRDYPPSTAAWVGRETELTRLSATNAHRVMSITGIGGQGKSALAARFLESRLSKEEVDFWDWLDCKEESHTLNTQLALVIQRLTAATAMTPATQGERTEYLIDTLFAVLGDRRAILVFDNTDQYVDVERGRFVAGMDSLVSRSLKTGHRSTFVFTCRPHLEFMGDGHLAIELEGLSREDAIRLFAIREVPNVTADPIRSKVERVQELTGGHPLWMNVIATQVSQQPERFDLLIERLEQDRNVALPRNLLLEVWQKLGAKQQKVLRYMAELVTAEDENRIAQCISPDLNFKDVHRALRTLRSLDLVVVKAAGAEEALELHPLVRQFIRQEFQRQERVKYIHPILRFFDRLLTQFAPAKGMHASMTHTHYAAGRVELYIHAGDVETAALALLDIHAALIEYGRSEEFVRLAAPLLDDAELDMVLYDKVLTAAVTILSDLGDSRDADWYLDRFEALIPGKTARYIKLCNLRCYSLWSRGDFALAIEWGSRGHELKTSAGLDTENDCQHHLALARRDSGNIQPALEYFRHGIPLDDILAGRIPDDLRDGGPFWGNIGRCLQLKGALSEARYCLVRSARALRGSVSSEVFVNRGWAARWLGEVAEAQGDQQGAYICYSAAQHYWLFSSPPRSKEMRNHVARLSGTRETVPQWRLERDYHDWLDRPVVVADRQG